MKILSKANYLNFTEFSILHLLYQNDNEDLVILVRPKISNDTVTSNPSITSCLYIWKNWINYIIKAYLNKDGNIKQKLTPFWNRILIWTGRKDCHKTCLSWRSLVNPAETKNSNSVATMLRNQVTVTILCLSVVPPDNEIETSEVTSLLI